MISGFIKIDKEQDYTSADVDAITKKRLNVKKAGHLGTLDPFATGLLLIGVNEATKLTTIMHDGDKEYIATLQLGKTTSSLDTETDIIQEMDVPSLSMDRIHEVLHSFLGKQTQIPPLYSARHYKGIKAYHLAREGSKVELPPMNIEIHEMECLSYDDTKKELVFRTIVSKGTYIRVLGKDIALRLGSIGYLTALRRTKIGDIDLSGAVKVKEVTENDLLGMTTFNPEIKKYLCDETLAFRVRNGQTLKLPDEQDEYLFMMDKDVLLALYRRDGHVYRCYKGFRYE
ncbi:MAG: tRNA pseudouridine(55) synthase TruB [Bacilli bacterium]|nr:tRNA pseudouridine(55) synthase TruB [Bacilli bacterium]